MIQCFAKPGRNNIFIKQPQILYACNMNQKEPIRALHLHKDVLEIMLITEGSGTFLIANRRYPVTAGNIIIINAGVAHEEISDTHSPMSQLCIGIGEMQLKGFKPLHLISDDSVPIYFVPNNFELYRQIFDMIYNQLYYDKTNANIICNAAIVSIIGLIIQDIGSGDTEKQSDDFIVTRASRYLQANFAEDITLDRLAEELKISKFYLSRLFKERSGYSLNEYINRLRIGEAQSLLISTDLSVQQVAANVGFESTSYFNSIFSRIVGTQPTKFRKNYRMPE